MLGPVKGNSKFLFCLFLHPIVFFYNLGLVFMIWSQKEESTHLIVKKFKSCHKELTSAVKDCPTSLYQKTREKEEKKIWGKDSLEIQINLKNLNESFRARPSSIGL